MAYTLDEFCSDSRAPLKSLPPQATALAQISERLGRLLSNPAFVAQTFSEASRPAGACSITIRKPTSTCLRTCRREEDREAAQPWGVMGDRTATPASIRR